LQEAAEMASLFQNKTHPQASKKTHPHSKNSGERAAGRAAREAAVAAATTTTLLALFLSLRGRYTNYNHRLRKVANGARCKQANRQASRQASSTHVRAWGLPLGDKCARENLRLSGFYLSAINLSPRGKPHDLTTKAKHSTSFVNAPC